MNDEDFYMVLPSNSSPDTHPNNNASDFIVTWKNPIHLNPSAKWKAALTELSYIYKPSTISTNLSIKYEKYVNKYIKESSYMIHFNPDTRYFEYKKVTTITDASEIEFGNKPSVRFDSLNYMNDPHPIFYSQYPFSLRLSQELHKALKIKVSYDNQIYATDKNSNDQWYIDCGITFPELEKLCQKTDETTGAVQSIDLGPFEFETYQYQLEKRVIHFSDEKNFENEEDLVSYIKRKCVDEIFHRVEYSPQTKRISLSCTSNLTRFEFTNGLNFVLGFDRTIYTANPLPHPLVIDYPPIIKAENAPQLNRGIINMYIYASICAPIYVGHTRVPLLKNVFIDSSNDVNKSGHARNYVVYNPMYVRLSSNTFNSIEINIRNDGGQLVQFPHGSITLLTIHFKKGL